MNILSIVTLDYLPKYVKFLKVIISKKMKLKKYVTMVLIGECIAIF